MGENEGLMQELQQQGQQRRQGKGEEGRMGALQHEAELLRAENAALQAEAEAVSVCLCLLCVVLCVGPRCASWVGKSVAKPS